MASPDNTEWHFPNRATPLGSATYYAVRFSPPAQRQRDALLIAWDSLIQDIAARPIDPGVARTKLDWWRTEIVNLTNGSARHPLALALQTQGLAAPASAAMIAVIDAAEDDIRSPRPADGSAFAASCRQGRGSFFEILAQLENANDDVTMACRDVGGYCAAVERVQRLAERPERVPPALSPASLGRLSTAQRVLHFDELLGQFDLSSLEKTPPLPGLARRLTALAMALHKKMRRTGYAVSDQLIDRPPIAHLWTAWRCR
ncbi:MAG: squalene/phytoene synthase family protein [Sedimenticolaceae bacterium]